MRPSRWLLAVLALILLVSAAPAAAQNPAPRNNVISVNVDGPRYPDDLLDEEEVARIELLQNGVSFLLPFSPVSPDDKAVLVVGTEQLGFLDVDDGSVRTISAEQFGPIIPLPFFGFSEFTWLDERTLAALGINLQAQRLEDLYVIVTIDRITLEIAASPLRIPSGTDILTVSPDLQKFLLFVLPPDESDQGEEGPAADDAIRELRVPVRYPTPQLRPGGRPALPGALRARVDWVLQQRPDLLDRVKFMQEDEDENTVEVTAQTVDLLRFDTGSGALEYVTTVPAASAMIGEAWSRDSTHLALSLISFNDPDEPRSNLDGALISEIAYRDATGNLPPADNPLLQGNNTYVVDFAGATRILRPGGEAAPPLLAAAGWSPDGQTLLTQAWHPTRLQGRTHPIYGPGFSDRASLRFFSFGELRETGRFAPPIFSAGLNSEPVATFLTPDELIVQGIAGTDRHPYYYNRVSGEFRNLADRAGSYFNIVSTNRSRQLLFMHTSFTTPPDMYKVGWDGRGLARLTWLNEELRQEANLAEYPVSFRLRNGQMRVGAVIQPAGEPFPPRNRPLVVWQEGGPGVPMIGQWAANVENPYALLPSFGFSLLVVPLAGRPGYTPGEFNALADRGNFGSIDIDEQAEIVQQAIARGWTSRGRIGITGCSYGGYFAWQSIIRHPDLYAAANPQCALVDLVSEWSRGFPTTLPYLQGLPPWANPGEYRADSPIYNAGRVRAAVLSFHGTEDFLPIVHNENLHLQLVNRGLPARMLRFADEGHGLRNPQNQAYAAQEQITWFRTYLR